jgi:hypothetical protein
MSDNLTVLGMEKIMSNSWLDRLLELIQGLKSGRITGQQLDYFVKNPSAVDSNWQREQIMFLPKGEKARNLSFPDKSGKLLCIFDNEETHLSSVFFGGELYGNFNYIAGLSVVDNKPLYIAKPGPDTCYYAVWGNIRSKEYSSLTGFYPPRIFDGKMLFVANQRNQKQILVWGEQESEEFDRIDFRSSPTVVERKWLFHVNEPKEFLVWGTKRTAEFKTIMLDVVACDGKLQYFTKDQEGGRYTFRIDDQAISTWDEYHAAGVINGNAAFIAQDNGDFYEVIGEKAKKIRGKFISGEAQIVKNKFVYARQEETGKIFLVNGDQELPCSDFPGIEWISRLIFGDDYCIYHALGKSGSAWFRNQEQLIFDMEDPKEYVSVVDVVNGIPVVFFGQSISWGKNRSPSFDEIFSVHHTDSRIVFGARKGRKIFRVTLPIN